MAQALAADVQLPRLPQASAHEHALVAVPKQIVDGDGAADIGVGAEADALELQMTVGHIVQHGVRQPEVRNPVAQHAPDLVPAVENGDAVAVPGQDDRDGQPGRAGPDDGGLAAVGGSGTLHHLVGVGGGNIALDHGKVHGRILDAPHAMPLALVFMVAYQGADRGQGIVFKQHPPRLVQPARLQQPDHLRDIGMNRAPLLTPGLFALQAAVRFFHHMQGHLTSSVRFRV